MTTSDHTLEWQSEGHQTPEDRIQHQQNKHIELHIHTIKKVIQDHILEVLFCLTDDQVADIFTKSFTESKFSKLRSMLGVQDVVIKGG